jgi:hypothetical protein
MKATDNGLPCFGLPHVPGHRREDGLAHGREAKKAVRGAASEPSSSMLSSRMPARSISHDLSVWKITLVLPYCFYVCFLNSRTCFLEPEITTHGSAVDPIAQWRIAMVNAPD